MAKTGYAVLTGTPNHMEIAKVADTWGQARQWARDHLHEMRETAQKFERDTTPRIDEALMKVKEASTPSAGQPIDVGFAYMGVQFRMQLKRVT